MYTDRIATLIITQVLIFSTAYAGENTSTADLGGSCDTLPNEICPDNVKIASLLSNTSLTATTATNVLVEYKRKTQDATKLTPALKSHTTLGTASNGELTKIQKMMIPSKQAEQTSLQSWIATLPKQPKP